VEMAFHFRKEGYKLEVLPGPNYDMCVCGLASNSTFLFKEIHPFHVSRIFIIISYELVFVLCLLFSVQNHNTARQNGNIYIYIYRTGIFDCRINLTSSGHLHFLSSFCDKIIIVDIIDSSSSLAFLLYIVLGFRFTNRHSL
jgi:hypothetical protein